MTNQAIGRSATRLRNTTPERYYPDRAQALALAFDDRWDEALPLLERVTRQYADDGDTWYLLGTAYFRTRRWQECVVALTHAIELGAALNGVPGASSPSNDLMATIAAAHAAMGDEPSAVRWLERALAARWDDRKSLIGNDDFSQLADSSAFQKLSGQVLDSKGNRNEEWRGDLAFLVAEIQRLHVAPYHAISSQAFNRKVVRLDREIPHLSDSQVLFLFMDLIGALGNGHNFLLPIGSESRPPLQQLPLQLYQFSDGLYVVGADKDYEKWVGSRVESIGGVPAPEALHRTIQVNARDNEMQHLWLAPYYLGLPLVLEGLGLAKNSHDVNFELSNTLGERFAVPLVPRAVRFRGFPTLPAPPNLPPPRYLSDVGSFYWRQWLSKLNALYVQVNAMVEKAAQSLDAFCIQVRKDIAVHSPQALILDLRHNAGGDGSIAPPLLRAMIHFENTQPGGKLFVIMGRNTFSAGQAILSDLDRLTDAIFVGEPSGSRPNAMGEAGWFRLPHSGYLGLISSQFHQTSSAEDHRIWIAPEVPVMLSSSDYFFGKDPAMIAIAQILQEDRNFSVAEPVLNRAP